MKHDYYLSNAPAETPLAEFARVRQGGASHRRMLCSAPRAKPAWPITKCARGVVGIIIKRCR